jgi:hypothetical protein
MDLNLRIDSVAPLLCSQLNLQTVAEIDLAFSCLHCALFFPSLEVVMCLGSIGMV